MKIIFFLILLFVFLLSVTGTFYFIFKKFYSRELKLRLSPITENELLTVKNTKFWFLGDSRIYQWNIPDTIIPANQYCNLGINSQTSAQILYRFSLHVQQGLPKYIFLQLGINDLKAIGIFPEKKDAIISQCIKNIELLINSCINYNLCPVFCTIFPPGDIQLFRTPIWSKEINNAVVYVNNTVTDFCKLKGVSIFDTYTALNDGKGVLIKKFQQDDLHLNEEGYNFLNTELTKFLSKEKIVNK